MDSRKVIEEALAVAKTLATSQQGRRSLYYVRGVVDMTSRITGISPDEVRAMIAPPVRSTAASQVVAALAAATRDEPVTGASLAAATGIKRTTASIYLADLHRRGRAERDRDGRTYRYWPAGTV